MDGSNFQEHRQEAVGFHEGNTLNLVGTVKNSFLGRLFANKDQMWPPGYRFL